MAQSSMFTILVHNVNLEYGFVLSCIMPHRVSGPLSNQSSTGLSRAGSERRVLGAQANLCASMYLFMISVQSVIAWVLVVVVVLESRSASYLPV